MRRRQTTFEFRQKLRAMYDKRHALNERKFRLLNRKFRKSPFYISAWIVRILYILVLILLFIKHYDPISVSEEIIEYKNIELYTSTSGGRYGSTKTNHADLTLVTNKDTYYTSLIGVKSPSYDIGDTIYIEKNMFNKPIYFFKQNWNIKIAISFPFIFYFLILGSNFISMFFNNIQDKSTVVFLTITMLISILSIAFYFLR